MDLKPIEPRVVETAARAQVARYRTHAKVARMVEDWMKRISAAGKKPTERNIQGVRDMIQQEFPGSYVWLRNEDKKMSQFSTPCRKVEIGGVEGVMNFSVYWDRDTEVVDVGRSMQGFAELDDWAKALEDRIPDIPEMAADYNAAIKVLKSVAQRCKARPGLDVARIVTFSPMAPLTDYFHGHEFI